MSKNSHWFKNKKYGYGWQPSSWQGWVLVVSHVSFLVVIALLIEGDPHLNLVHIFGFGFLAILATFILFYTAINHAPRPKWQWGEKR